MKKKFLLVFFLLPGLLGFGQDSLPASALKEFPVLFQQTAAEYRALCYQAFNIALCRLNAIPRKQYKKQKLAIITDLDETIIDNSYAEAELIKQGKTFDSKNWKNWVSLAQATEVPGAVEFLKEASRRGITIYYISNRDTSTTNATLINLQKLNLPNADTAHLFLLSNKPSKEDRRLRVMADHTVVMLLGDNLNDFANVFEALPIVARLTETDKWKAEWGNKFIVLPNPTYGEWENALYQYKRGLSNQQKEAIRKELLKGY